MGSDTPGNFIWVSIQLFTIYCLSIQLYIYSHRSESIASKTSIFQEIKLLRAPGDKTVEDQSGLDQYLLL